GPQDNVTGKISLFGDNFFSSQVSNRAVIVSFMVYMPSVVRVFTDSRAITVDLDLYLYSDANLTKLVISSSSYGRFESFQAYLLNQSTPFYLRIYYYSVNWTG